MAQPGLEIMDLLLAQSMHPRLILLEIRALPAAR
jgi:hypothetical protein